MKKHQFSNFISLNCLALWGLLLASGCSTVEFSSDELLERAAVLCDHGRGDEALFALDQVSQQMPEQPRTYYLQGVAYELVQNDGLAKRAYDDCLRLEPENPDALNNRGVVQARLGRLEESIADLIRATQINPSDPLALTNLALAYHDRHQYELAIATYDKALSLTTNPQLLLQLGNVQQEMRNFVEAEKRYSESIILSPQFAPAFLGRASARLELGRLNEALADLDSAKRFDRDGILQGVIQDMRFRIERSDQKGTSVSKANTEPVRRWLEDQGWHLQENAESVFGYSMAKIDTPSTRAETRDVLILMRDSNGDAVCEYDQANTALKSDRPTALIVVDQAKLNDSTFQSNSQADNPNWLIRVDLQWRPTRADFAPRTVTVRTLPTTASR